MKPPNPTKRTKKKKKKKNPCPLQPAPVIGAGSQAEADLNEGIGEGKPEDNGIRGLNWLIDVFSSVSINQVVSAYREACGDPYKAAGILGAHLEDPLELHKGGSGGRSLGRGREKPKRAATASGMVSDVIGKDYLRSSASCDKGRARKGAESESRAASAEDAEQFLCSMLGDDSEIGMGIVKDVLGQCNYDVEKALNALLNLSSTYHHHHNRGNVSKDEVKGVNYANIFSGLFIKSKTSLENNSTDLTSDSSYHSFEEHELPQYGPFDSREYLEDFPNSDVQHPRTRSAIVKPEIQQEVLESLFNMPEYPKNQPRSMNWKKIVEKLEPFGQGSNSCDSSIAGKGDVYQGFHSVARKHWDTMTAYGQQAALAYSKREYGHASYLSDKVKYYRQLAKQADEEASHAIFEARNKDIENTVTIDLHGQHVKQAVELLKHHILLFSYTPSVHFLRVITGRGVDGVGKGKLKRSVLGLVEREGIKYIEENAGSLLLRLDRPKEYSFIQHDTDTD